MFWRLQSYILILFIVAQTNNAIANNDINTQSDNLKSASQTFKDSPIKAQCGNARNYNECYEDFSIKMLESYSDKFQEFGESLIVFPKDISMAPKVFHDPKARFSVLAYYPKQEISIISKSSWKDQYNTAFAFFHKTGNSIEAYKHIAFSPQDGLLAVYNMFNSNIDADIREPNKLTIYRNGRQEFDFDLHAMNYGVVSAVFKSNVHLILNLISWAPHKKNSTCSLKYQHQIWQFEDIACLDTLISESIN